MLDTVDRPSDCARYIKEIAELKEAFIEADVESGRRCIQLKDEISELNNEDSHIYGQLEDARAEIKRLKAKHNSKKSKQEAGVRAG